MFMSCRPCVRNITLILFCDLLVAMETIFSFLAMIWTISSLKNDKKAYISSSYALDITKDKSIFFSSDHFRGIILLYLQVFFF